MMAPTSRARFVHDVMALVESTTWNLLQSIILQLRCCEVKLGVALVALVTETRGFVIPNTVHRFLAPFLRR